MPEEKHISRKIWQMTNEILRALPMECRTSIIENIVKSDVRLCVENNGVSDPICQSMATEAAEMEEYLLSERNAHELPIYKIGNKYYFRDVRLGEYRNIKDPNDRKPIDSVSLADLQKPTAEDIKKVYGECDKNPCDLKIKGKRDELMVKESYDEPYEQEKFIRIIGGIAKADRLQSIWSRSYPHSTSNIFRPITKEQDFRDNAKREGFTDKQIDAFLRLK